MNYLAHLFLARKTPDSHFGNLLGDFRRGVDVSVYSSNVLLGLENHYAVDKFTDAHENVVNAKQYFHSSRKRFAPVALDIYFDHLLIKHWRSFSHIPFEQFCATSFNLLKQGLPKMPRTMQHSIGHMITHNWFEDYAKEEGIAKAISVVAKRIRFTNEFHKTVDDIEKHKHKIEKQFLSFFPELITFVSQHGPESTLK